MRFEYSLLPRRASDDAAMRCDAVRHNLMRLQSNLFAAFIFLPSLPTFSKPNARNCVRAANARNTHTFSYGST